MRRTRIAVWCAASALAGAAVAGAFASALMAQGSPAQAPRPYVQAGPQPNGTPVPRTAWGKADLSGVWNKRPTAAPTWRWASSRCRSRRRA